VRYGVTAAIDDLWQPVLTRRNADLTTASALWHSKAAHLDEQLKQLRAGEAVESPG
jgi:hypothetical protein